MIAFGVVTLAAVIRVLGPLSISTYSTALYIVAMMFAGRAGSSAAAQPPPSSS